jgi:hypothetical protein
MWSTFLSPVSSYKNDVNFYRLSCQVNYSWRNKGLVYFFPNLTLRLSSKFPLL